MEYLIKIIDCVPEDAINFDVLSNSHENIWKVVRKYPNRDWAWKILSSRKIIDINFILENKSKPWDWDIIALSESLTLKIIQSNPDIKWNLHNLAQNNHIFEQSLTRKRDIFWIDLSDKSSLAVKHVSHKIKNPLEGLLDGVSLDWDAMSKFITLNYNSPDKYNNFPWEWMSKNEELPIEFLIAHKDLPWNWSHISKFCRFDDRIADKIIWSIFLQNKNLNYKIIKKYAHKIVDWPTASRLANIACMGNILDTEIPWDYDELSNNKMLLWTHVRNNPYKPWNYNNLSKLICVTWDVICYYPELFNDKKEISLNPNITWKIVYENLKMPWNYTFLISDRYSAYDNCEPYKLRRKREMTNIILEELIAASCRVDRREQIDMYDVDGYVL
jgi:hypothetical protein